MTILWYSWDRRTGRVREVGQGEGLAGMGAAAHFLKKTQVGDEVLVSTVFCGNGEPRFETRVFGGALSGEEEVYGTRAEAERGHARMVRRCRRCLRG